MVFRKTACALTLMFSAFSIAQPAAATTILITYTGTVTSGYDAAGLFGAPNTSLTNDKFKSVYTLTYPTPGAIDNSYSGYHEIYGGTDYSQSPTSPLSGQLTINGHTVSVDGKYRGYYSLIGPSFLPSSYHGKASQIFDRVRSNPNSDLLNYVSSSSGDNFISSLNFADALNHTVTSSDVSYGYFQSPSNDAGLSAHATLVNSAVSVQSISAAPEPATWGMMIFGFGIAGATLRARRRETALA